MASARAVVTRWTGLVGMRKLAWLAGLAGVALCILYLLAARAVDATVGAVVAVAAGMLAALNLRERLQAIVTRNRSLMEEARALLRDGHYQRAGEQLKAVLELDPGNDQAYLLMSAMRRSTQDAAGALSVLQRAVTENPESARNHYHLALAWMEAGEIHAGTQELMAALECDEYFLDVYYMLGTIYEAERETERAIRCYEEMIWMAERWPEGRPMPGLGNLQKARDHLRALVGDGLESAP